MKTSAEELMTIKAVAQACRVNPVSIHTAIRKGQLQVIKLSKRNWRITRSEFNRWIKSLTQNGGAK